LVAINDIQITRGDGADPGVIQTSNFVSGSTGWRIKGDGDAEFNDVTVRGEIVATSGSIQGELSIGSAGVIKLEESSVNKFAVGKNGLALSSAITSSTANARLEFRDDPVLTSTGLNTGANPTRLYLEVISPIGPGQAELWSGYNFAFKGASGVVFNFENKVASSVAADSDNDLMRRTDSDSRYGRLGSANSWTGANTFTGNVVVPDSTTSTHALRVSTADGRYVRSDQANTYTDTQTFRHNQFRIENSTETGFFARIQHVNAGNRDYILPNQAGTFWTSGNLGVAAISPPAPFSADTWVVITVGGNQYAVQAMAL
jgi:hypothetical protein